jgi:hypothetical protein
MQILGTDLDVKGTIERKAMDLTRRTGQLMTIYDNQIRTLQSKEKK